MSPAPRQHTPGPWDVEPKGSRHFVDGADGRRLAKLEAINADLLNLLTAADRLEELTGENLAVYARTYAALARAAIAKAKGGAA